MKAVAVVSLLLAAMMVLAFVPGTQAGRYLMQTEAVGDADALASGKYSESLTLVDAYAVPGTAESLSASGSYSEGGRKPRVSEAAAIANALSEGQNATSYTSTSTYTNPRNASSTGLAYSHSG